MGHAGRLFKSVIVFAEGRRQKPCLHFCPLFLKAGTER
jgi:hypothetical protein